MEREVVLMYKICFGTQTPSIPVSSKDESFLFPPPLPPSLPPSPPYHYHHHPPSLPPLPHQPPLPITTLTTLHLFLSFVKKLITWGMAKAIEENLSWLLVKKTVEKAVHKTFCSLPCFCLFQSRFCSNLGLPLDVQKAATHIARRAVDLDLVPGYVRTWNYLQFLNK